MTDQSSSPDFNDEYLKYGLSIFSSRLRKRLEIAKKEAQPKKQSIPSSKKEIKAPGFDELSPPEEHGQQTDGWQIRFLMGRDGPKGCAQNVCLIFENDLRWKGVFAENVFTGVIDIVKQPPIPEIEIGELSDQQVSMIHVWIEENYQIVVQDAAMKKALITISTKNRYHPVKDYLNELPAWDNKPRADQWLIKALGAKDVPEEYLNAVGSRFLIGSIRRIMNSPESTKVDNMLVFEGLQGGGKSTLIEALFTPWHGDTPLPLGDKDAYINIRGCWGYELAEMDSFNKATVSTAKSFLSSHTDNYRPPFGTKNMKYPRQTVLIGSVNHNEYLTDSSGNRRYWPIWANKIDIKWLRDNREQLWAEALYRYRQGEIHWVDEKIEVELSAMIKYEQALREHPDAWEALLFVWMDSTDCRKDHYSHIEIFEYPLKIDIRAINKSHEMKLSNAMQKLGWMRQRKRVDGYKTPRPHLYITPQWVIDKRKSGKSAPNVTEAQF